MSSHFVDTRGMRSRKAIYAELERTLRRDVSGEVRFDAGSRALYATDASNYRQVPMGVVVPRTIDDVIATVAACRRFDAPVLSRGAGTGLCGRCCNVAVVIDFSKYLHHIVELDADARYAWVEPGCVLDHLRNAAEKHHFTFGPPRRSTGRCATCATGMRPRSGAGSARFRGVCPATTCRRCCPRTASTWRVPSWARKARAS